MMTRSNPVQINALCLDGVWMASWEYYKAKDAKKEAEFTGEPKVIKRSKANEDCYCGSGKKVKNCPCKQYVLKR